MRTRAQNESGETLIEIIISLLVIGLVFGAFFAAIATTSTASKTHRDLVSADAMLRDSAELTKDAVRDDCTAPGATYSVAYSTLPQRSGFAYPPDVTGHACPPTTGTLPIVHLSVTTPGSPRSLDVVVRAP
jgi:hypothetical protein